MGETFVSVSLTNELLDHHLMVVTVGVMEAFKQLTHLLSIGFSILFISRFEVILVIRGFF